MFGFVLVLITVFFGNRCHLAKSENFAKLHEAWRNIGIKITTNHLFAPRPPPFPIFPITKVWKDFYNGNFNRRFVYLFLVFVFSQNNLKYIFGIWGCSNIFEALVFFLKLINFGIVLKMKTQLL
jgi:hypothetical protein